MSQDRKLFSLFGNNDRSDRRSGPRISNQSIDSLGILITLTLDKLARPLTGTEFCSCDRIHFQTQSRYMVCKTTLFRCSFEQWNWECRRQNPITWMHQLCMSVFKTRTPWSWHSSALHWQKIIWNTFFYWMFQQSPIVGQGINSKMKPSIGESRSV